MTILASKDTRVLIQGITGKEGRAHTLSMQKYGTIIVAGVTPGKGGSDVDGISVYDTVQEAVKNHSPIDASVIFVPAQYASDAVYEAVDGGIKVITIITERIPVHDEIRFIEYARSRGIKIIGPNCPGIISPGECKLGIMPTHLFTKGPIGMVSRSGTLTYEIAWALTRSGLGQSTAVGIGGDPVIGSDFFEIIEMFENDSETKGIALVGEIGGDAEERLASRLKSRGLKKPIVVFIAGRTAPPGKRMGHAGAIISMGSGTAEAKRFCFRAIGLPVADLPSEIPSLMIEALRKADYLQK